MGRKTCVVCGSGISSKCHITYHRFPSDVSRLKRWCDSLQLNIGGLSKYSYHCSIHFATTDIMKTAKRTYINPNAIPFVSKGRIQSLTSQKNRARGLKKDLEIVLSEDESVRQDSNLDESNIINESFSTITASEGDDCENKSDRDDLHSGDRVMDDPRIDDSFKILSSTSETLTASEVGDDCATQSSSLKRRQTEGSRKRKISQARYFGDIEFKDLEIPQKRRQFWDIARKTVCFQKREIKNLQQKTRRLKKRIYSLQGLLKHLRQQNLIFERAQITLNNSMSESTQALFSVGC